MVRFLCLLTFYGFFVNLKAQKKFAKLLDLPLYLDGSSGITFGGDDVNLFPLAALNLSGGISLHNLVDIGISRSFWGAHMRDYPPRISAGRGIQLRFLSKVSPLSFKFDYGWRTGGGSVTYDLITTIRNNVQKSDKYYFRMEFSIRVKRLAIGVAYQSIGRQVDDNFNEKNQYIYSSIYTPDVISVFIGFSSKSSINKLIKKFKEDLKK